MAIDIYVARCDDCNHPIAAATTRAQVELRLRRRGWRPGRPLFCRDQQACGERTWQRYGRHMQAMIDAQTQRLEATR